MFEGIRALPFVLELLGYLDSSRPVSVLMYGCVGMGSVFSTLCCSLCRHGICAIERRKALSAGAIARP